MVAQTVTGTRTSSLEIPTTVPIVVILVPPLERRLPLRVVSSVRIEWSSFPMISRRISPVSPAGSRANHSLCSARLSPFLPTVVFFFCAFLSLGSRYATTTSGCSIGAPHVGFDDGIVLGRVYGLVHLSWLVSSVVIITKLRSFSAARARSRGSSGRIGIFKPGTGKFDFRFENRSD